MSKFKFSKKARRDALNRVTRRNPNRVKAQHVDPIAYQEMDAFASLDDEIENDAIRTAGNQPFENPEYHARYWDLD